MKNVFLILTMSLLTTAVFGQTKEKVVCRIWKTKSFCEIPENVNVHGAVIYQHASMLGVSCNSLDTQNFVGVWVTFQGKNVDSMKMKSRYENISLIRKNTKEVLHPVAYMERADQLSRYTPAFNSNESTFKECIFVLNSNEKYDLFILFEAAEIGDKLVIEDFLEAEIKKK